MEARKRVGGGKEERRWRAVRGHVKGRKRAGGGQEEGRWSEGRGQVEGRNRAGGEQEEGSANNLTEVMMKRKLIKETPYKGLD